MSSQYNADYFNYSNKPPNVQHKLTKTLPIGILYMYIGTLTF